MGFGGLGLNFGRLSPSLLINAAQKFLGAFFGSLDVALHIVESRDGMTFTDTGAFFDPAPDAAVRDPSLLKVGSSILMAYTNVTDASVKCTSFSMATSSDGGRSFSRLGTVDCSGASGNASTARTWAPELFQDLDGSIHAVVAISSDYSTFNIYETHPLNQNNLAGGWSAPAIITGTQYAAGIDAFLMYSRAVGKYLFTWKAGTYNKTLSSTSPFSGYDTVYADLTSLGQQEGFCSVRARSGKLLAYFDSTISGGNGLQYAESSDEGVTWTSPKYLTIQNPRVNLLKNPRILRRNSSTGSVSISSAPSAAGPNGAYDAYTYTDASSSQLGFVQEQVTIPADTSTYFHSVHFKKTVGATVFPGLSLELKNGTTQESGIIVNTNTGVAYPNSGWGTAPPAVGRYGVEDTGDFWRSWVAVTNIGTNTLANCYISPAANTTGNDGTRGSTGVGSLVLAERNLTVGTALLPFDWTINGQNMMHGTVIRAQ